MNTLKLLIYNCEATLYSNKGGSKAPLIDNCKATLYSNKGAKPPLTHRQSPLRSTLPYF